jgi:hypothetical protein
VTNRESAGEARAASEILGYFLRNPCAADDAIGIASWRLLQERVQHSVSESEAALARLVEHGFLLVERRAGRVIFRLNPERAAEAAEYLRRHPPG